MGDIKRTIREEVKKKLRSHVSNWDPDSQPNIYELDKFLRKSGYRLVDVVPHNKRDTELLIEPIKSNYAHPNIEHGVEEGKFYIEVIKYGLLDSSDVEEVIKGYENALAIVTYLESLDLSDLEIEG